MKDYSFSLYAAVVMCICCFSGMTYGAEEHVRPISKKDQDKAVSELKKVSAQTAGHANKVGLLLLFSYRYPASCHTVTLYFYLSIYLTLFLDFSPL